MSQTWHVQYFRLRHRAFSYNTSPADGVSSCVDTLQLVAGNQTCEHGNLISPWLNLQGCQLPTQTKLKEWFFENVTHITECFATAGWALRVRAKRQCLLFASLSHSFYRLSNHSVIFSGKPKLIYSSFSHPRHTDENFCWKSQYYLVCKNPMKP